MPFSRISSGLAVLAILAVVGALAGCGGSTSTQSAALTTTTTTSVSSTTPSSTSSTSNTSSASSSSAASDTASTASHSASTTASTSSQTSSTRTASTAAKTPKHTVARLALASDAFPKGGAIPVQYTCHGSNLPPPLQWSHVPAGTTQMFLLALSLNGESKGPIRWAVGGISPSAGGFGPAHLPAGAVVGRSSDGHVGWVGPCPAGSQPETIVVLMYALRSKLNLRPGFEPSTVQRELSGDTLASGVAYGAYRHA